MTTTVPTRSPQPPRASSALGLLGLWLGLAALPALAQGGPTHRYALVVGNDNGGEGTRELQYARDDAKKIHDIMVRLGGVKGDDAVLLLDDTAEDLLSSLGDIERRSAAARARGERTALFFYYSGHAKDGELRLGKTKLPLESLKSRLAQSPADVRVAVLDACRSGSLTRTKGVRRAPAFEVESDANRAAKGLVILTSSSADEDSQESDTIGGSFFSHHLASGLLGDADQSGDRRVTLGEAYAYAYERTVADTADSAAGPQHPTFSFDLAGNGDLVLTDVATRREGVLIPASSPAGAYFFVSPRGFVVAEVSHTVAIDRVVALPIGHYFVKRRLPNYLRIGELDVEEGQLVLFDESALKNSKYADDPVKGAVVSTLYTRHWSMALNGSYQLMFATPPEQGGYFPSSPSLGLDVTFHNAFGRGFTAGFDGLYGFASGTLNTGTIEPTKYNYSLISLGFSGLYEWPDGRFVPFVGLRLGLNFMGRTFPEANLPAQNYQTFVPGLVLGLKVRVTRNWAVIARGRLNYLLYNIDETKSFGFLELAALINYEFGS